MQNFEFCFRHTKKIKKLKGVVRHFGKSNFRQENKQAFFNYSFKSVFV